MGTELGELFCTVTMEQLAASGESLKKSTHRNALLTLGRNEFKDVILKVELGKRECKYLLREIQLFKNFAKDGKATMKFPAERMQLMVSNCPPDQLIMFLKTMSTKLECLKMKGFASARQKMLSAKPRTFQHISPLTMKELQTVHTARATQAENSSMITPKGKRKRQNDQENEQPKVNSVL